MRALHFLIATWVVSTQATPLRTGKHQQRRTDPVTLPIKGGQQLESPCPDLIDPQTGSIALYFYNGITTEQRRATQFVNDHWGLPGCCNSQVHSSCASPLDPQPYGAPCPLLKDENGNLLLFYGNPYTTDQITSNWVIVDALSRGLCPPNGRGSDENNTISLSPPTSWKPQTGQASASDDTTPPVASTLPVVIVQTPPKKKFKTAPVRTSSPKVIDSGFAEG